MFVRRQYGFSLVEVMVAIAVVLLGLVPLLQLHVQSLRTMSRAEQQRQAHHIAKTKMAEVLITGAIREGVQQGRVDDDSGGGVYDWQVSVSPVTMDPNVDVDLTHLKRVTVAMKWRDGRREETLILESLAIDEALERKGHRTPEPVRKESTF